MRIYAASDHAGFSLRKILVDRLRGQGKEVIDLGTDSDTACDYPEFAYAVAGKVRGEPGALGILVCATGLGMAMAAGKVRGIRAVSPCTIEAARLSRIDNNANVLCLAGKILSESDAFAMVDSWLSTGFAGGRHARRIAKVAAIETASAVAFVSESERLQLVRRGFPGKLFQGDASLFASEAATLPSMREKLAWVSLPQDMVDKTGQLVAFAEQARQARIKDAILIFDAGQGAAVASLCRAWGTAGIRLHPCADAAALAEAENAVHLESTLVVVLSRARHACRELHANEQRLWSSALDLCGGNAESAGQHFAAIACPNSELIRLAEAHRYRAVFVDPPDVDECFAALGFAGLVPAALAALDPVRLMARATAMADSCRGERLEDNPGASLGILLGAMAKHGRRKMTLVRSRSLAPLARWIALLMARTTASARPSLDVLDGEPLQASYPADRVFVHLQSPEDPPAIASEAMEALHIAGQPYIQIVVPDRLEVAAEIFRWQVAAAVAALVLGVNPFLPASG